MLALHKILMSGHGKIVQCTVKRTYFIMKTNKTLPCRSQ